MSAPQKRSAATLAGVHGAAQQKHQAVNPNSAQAQRQRIAEHLLAYGSLDTETARMTLDIYHPPARVQELRNDGWGIVTVFVDRETASAGRTHRVGKYLLVKAGRQP